MISNTSDNESTKLELHNEHGNVKVVGTQVQRMFASIANRYDLTNSVLSGGIHHLWKRRTTAAIPKAAKNVLDLCTGTGDLVPLLEQPGRTVIAADFCEEMMTVGRKRFPNIQFVFADAMSLPFQDAIFDGVTVAFGVRNFESLDQGLSELARVLKPGGTLSILEFGQPPNKIFAALYSWYSKNLLPIFGKFLTGNGEAYRYLPATAAAFPCGAQFNERLKRAGFTPQHTEVLTFGVAYLYVATRAGARSVAPLDSRGVAPTA